MIVLRGAAESKTIWTDPNIYVLVQITGPNQFGQVQNSFGPIEEQGKLDIFWNLVVFISESKKSIHTLAIPSTIALNVCSIKPRLETSKRTYCKNPAGPECVWVADKTTFSAL